MVVSTTEAALAGGVVAVPQAGGKPAGVLVKPPYYKRFFKQLWTLLYHKQGRHSILWLDIMHIVQRWAAY